MIDYESGFIDNTDLIVRGILAELDERPDSKVAANAAIDRWQDLGHPLEGAVVWALRVVRHARMRKVLAHTGDLGRMVRNAVWDRVHVSHRSRIPIQLRGGAMSDSQPELTGTAPFHTFRKGGGVCGNPDAARKAGHKTDYHKDTRVVRVGVIWLEKLVQSLGRTK